ncbi:hypothetical protein EJB05_06827, partial [Eragrostis curvula]
MSEFGSVRIQPRDNERHFQPTLGFYPDHAKLTRPNLDRALAKDVLPNIRHPFDRNAVVRAGKEICEHVAAACADERIAHGGAHVLLLIDTFACPVVFRRLPLSLQMQRVVSAPPKIAVVVVKTPNLLEDLGSTVPAEKPKLKPVGVIWEKRPKPAAEEMFKGWVPW